MGREGMISKVRSAKDRGKFRRNSASEVITSNAETTVTNTNRNAPELSPRTNLPSAARCLPS